MDRAHRVIELTNQERTKRGLRALTWNEQLFKAAQNHCKNMAEDDFFSHQDRFNRDHKTPVERAKNYGYPSSYVGENIAAGSSTPEEVVRNWMDSPKHRDNILNPKYTEIGVGHHYLGNDGGKVNHKHYWTQVFGKR
jgi:uncharacterized protein YkwD